MGSEVSSYKVLARKYRPRSFQDLIGQDLVVKILQNAFGSNRIAHAFILTGIRGVGKTTTARIIASCLNCTGNTLADRPTIDPCGTCDSCNSISKGNHVDVLEIDAASRTGVGDVREIIDSVKYKPASSRYKVFIIDEVHMLSNSAFNALLKTLEEPPEHTKFIFATTEIQKIPITVISRCQRYDLNRVSPDTLIKFLKNILEKENKFLEDNALSMVVRASEGSVRDSLSILDQIILQNDGQIELTEIQEILGLSDRHKLIDLFELILVGDNKSALYLLRSLFKSGGDPILIMREVSEIIHWITTLKVAPDLSKDPLFTSFEKEKGSSIAAKIPLNVLTKMWQVLVKSLNEDSIYNNKFAHTEMAIIRLTTVSSLPAPIEIIKDYQRLSKKDFNGEQKKKGLNDDLLPYKFFDQTKDLVNLDGVNPNRIEYENIHYLDAPEVKKSPIGEKKNKSKPFEGSLEDQRKHVKDNDLEISHSSETLVKKHLKEDEILGFLRKSKEIPLLVEVENLVSFISCSLGELTLELKDDSPSNLISRLTRVLEEITGISWKINLTENSGKKTVKEQRLETEEVMKNKLMNNDVVKSVLETFPGSNIFFDDKENNVL